MSQNLYCHLKICIQSKAPRNGRAALKSKNYTLSPHAICERKGTTIQHTLQCRIQCNISLEANLYFCHQIPRARELSQYHMSRSSDDPRQVFHSMRTTWPAHRQWRPSLSHHTELRNKHKISRRSNSPNNSPAQSLPGKVMAISLSIVPMSQPGIFTAGTKVASPVICS